MPDWLALSVRAANNAMWDYIEQEYNDAVNRWKSAVSDFEAQLERLRSLYPAAVATGDIAAWQEQYDKAVVMKQVIADLQSKLGGVVDWFKRVFGLAGLDAMGAVPLVPVAIIIGSISAVTSLTYAIYSYNNELEQKWSYVKSQPGMTPNQVTDFIGGGSIIPSKGDLITWIVIGGVALYFGPKMLDKAIKGKK